VLVKICFAIFRFPGLFTSKGVLALQLGKEKTGGRERYGREQVKCTSPSYFRTCFTVHFTPVVKRTWGKHKR
jgi:hypothetical protein